MNEQKTRSFLNVEGGCLWTTVGAVLAIFFLIAKVLISALNRIKDANEGGSIAITVLPYNTSTGTPDHLDVNTTETVSPGVTQDPGEIIFYSIGELVEIHGTEGDGLRLRNAPSLDSTINILALENEVFEIRGGPEEVDGYIWWFLINPYDNTIQGWSVGNFLRRLSP